jgi:hypothetical protein
MYDVKSLMPSADVRDPLVWSGLIAPTLLLASEMAAETRIVPQISRACALMLAGVKLSRRDRKLVEE